MNLLIRADANAQMGTGHVMRCLALAQAWQDAGGQAVFVMATDAPAVEDRLKSEGMEVTRLRTQPGTDHDAIQTVDLARQGEASWAVVDGYHFGADYQRIIKDSGLHLLAIDDNGHCSHYYAEIVLNQNLHADEGLYENREPYTQLLVGTRYVLLRPEFLKWRGWKREIPEVARKVLVTLGGGDPDNVTLKVIRALQQIEVEGLEAVALVGGSNPHYEELQSAVQGSQLLIRLETNVTNMSELMAWADVAVSAGGSTCWELAFMGMPTVAVVLAENQRDIAEGLKEAGVALNIGWHSDVSTDSLAETLVSLLGSQEIRHHMSHCGKPLVDGTGARRIVEALKSVLPRDIESS